MPWQVDECLLNIPITTVKVNGINRMGQGFNGSAREWETGARVSVATLDGWSS